MRNRIGRDCFALLSRASDSRGETRKRGKEESEKKRSRLSRFSLATLLDVARRRIKNFFFSLTTSGSQRLLANSV